MKNSRRNQVNLASFKEAFEKFLSFCDEDMTPECLISSFRTLKEEGKIRFENEPEFWNGNHCRSESVVELFLVDEPLRFYVVKFSYWEIGRHLHGDNDVQETHVFVPK